MLLKKTDSRNAVQMAMEKTKDYAIAAWLMAIFSFGVFFPSQAQQEWTDGSLDPVEIEIVTERQIKLPQANRNFEKIPPGPSDPIKPPVTYHFQALHFQAPAISPLIRPLKLKQQSSAKVYGGYLSLGYGNYSSPYLEGFINSGRDKNRLVGARVWHSSSAKGPVDGKNSGSGTSGISLFGKTFGTHVSLKGKLGFENNFTHFYGYPPAEEVNRDTIRQVFNRFSLGGSVSNTKNADFSYELGGDFRYLADKFDAQETEADINFQSSYKLSDETDIALNATYYIISRKDAMIEVTPRSLLVINGAYQFVPMEGLRVSAGLIAAYENDTLDTEDLHLYPDISAVYNVTPSVDVIGRLTGGIEKVSLHTLVAENFWLAPNIDIFHTNKTFELQAGVNARLGKKVEARTGVTFSVLKNLYYYVNSPDDQAKFETVYDDGSTKRSNFYGSLSFAQTEQAKFLLRGDYYAYTTGTLDEAWHRPVYRVSASGSYNLYQKLLFNASIIMQGGMKALVPETQEVLKLPAAIDLNARAEYLVSDSFSVFAQFNNITSKKYPVFLNYPVRGFQALAGITWSF